MQVFKNRDMQVLLKPNSDVDVGEFKRDKALCFNET